MLCPLIVFISLFDHSSSQLVLENSLRENSLIKNSLIFSGHWKNQDDSLMFMKPVSMTKYLIEWVGWYHSGVGRKNVRDIENEKIRNRNSTPGNYSLTGRSYIMEGNQIISWNVVWANSQARYYSITTWNGYISSQNAKNNFRDKNMMADWFLTDGKAASWNHTMIGEDFFTKVSS